MYVPATFNAAVIADPSITPVRSSISVIVSAVAPVTTLVMAVPNEDSVFAAVPWLLIVIDSRL